MAFDNKFLLTLWDKDTGGYSCHKYDTYAQAWGTFVVLARSMVTYNHLRTGRVWLSIYGNAGGFTPIDQFRWEA